VHEEDILLIKGPTGAPERKPFDTRHEASEREWFVVCHLLAHACEMPSAASQRTAFPCIMLLYCLDLAACLPLETHCRGGRTTTG
jgi:hypothetical protein